MALSKRAYEGRAARRAVTRTSACVLALVTATAAQAQETPPPADADAAPADIVVTANTRAESLSSDAMAVRVETGEKHERQNAHGLQDSADNMRNVLPHTLRSVGPARRNTPGTT